jgi:hypothetical protein
MKIGFTHHSGFTTECLPQIDPRQSDRTGRKLLFALLQNSLREPDLLKKPGSWDQDFFEILLDRLFELLHTPDRLAAKAHRDRLALFLEQMHLPRSLIADRPISQRAIRLLSLFFNGERIGLSANADGLFTQTVLRRMIPKNEGQTLLRHEKGIWAPKPESGLLVLPRWQDFDADAAQSAVPEAIAKAGAIGADSVYLLYPRNARLCSYKNLTQADSACRVAAVPYSFSFAGLKKQRS